MSSSKKSGRKDKDDTSNPDVNLPGIGNYLFQKTVGEGNFAKVKLATHKMTGQEVAIKVIDKTTLDEKKLGKLHREVRIMKLLHHPNIVKLYEVIETRSTLYLIMEYASGGELYDYLVVHGKMKEKEARAKFRQILSAVNYCHKKRVIHRDLKAENLLLDSNLDIKIADFGFSNYYDPESKLDTFCGSPPYAAPELFQGRRYTGPEVDLWSLGVILYVLTTGCLPFDGKNLQEMRESVCRGKYRIPFFLSDGCEKLLRKFLVRDPAKRNSLEIVIDDPWIMESYEDSPITTDLSQSVVEDETVIKIMETKYKIDKETILQVLRENIYNDVSAVYFMLYYDKDKERHLNQSAEPDIIKITSPVPSKKDVRQPAPNLVMIDEDAVMPHDLVSPNSNQVTSFTAPPAQAVAARRRRAATVTDTPTFHEAPLTLITTPNPAAQVTSNPSNPPQPASAVSERPPPPTTRKRTNTIVELLKGGSKKEPVESAENETSSDGDRPRSLRFTFNSNTTSTKPPDEIIVELVKCCNKIGLTHRLLTRYLLECTSSTSKEPVKVEIEVCKLPRLNNLHGLKFKRLSGPSADYKDICGKLLATVQI